MNTKKFIPCIYLYQKQALEGPDKGRSGLGIDPVELAGFYADNGADELTCRKATRSMKRRWISSRRSAIHRKYR